MEFNITSTKSSESQPFSRARYWIDIPTEDSWSDSGEYVRNTIRVRSIEIPRELATYIYKLQTTNRSLTNENELLKRKNKCCG